MSEYDVQENHCNGNHSTCHPTRSFWISRIPCAAANGIEYELWFISLNSHLARWYKFPSRRAVSSHSTLTPGIFAYLSDGCLWVTRYSLPSRCASRTLDLLRYFSRILAISPLRENKFSLWNNTKISVLFPYAAPTHNWTLKRVTGKIRIRRSAPSWKTWSKISYWLPVR